MADFLHIVFSFPTVVYTVLLGLSMLVFALSVLGGIGADALDLDVDISGAEDAGLSVFDILSTFGVGKVPMSIFAAAFAFSGWILSYIAVLAFAGTTEVGVVMGMLILTVVTLMAFPASGLLVAPLTVLLESDEGATSGHGLVGEVCTISSGRVDDRFGRARCYIDGTELVLSIRCMHDNDLSRGDEALILEYSDDDDIYVVESVDAIMSEEIPADIGVGETILDDIDFEELEETTERHRKEKQKIQQA